MKKLDPGVAAYFKSLSPSARATLSELRRWIFEAAPHTSETMLYRMPTYVLGEPWVSYKAQKAHFSLYFCEASVMRKYAEALAGLDVGKGCIRFKSIEDLSKRILMRMLKETAKIRGFRDLPAKGAMVS